MEGEYVSSITLELQPRSRRGYRRLFGIRENGSFDVDAFDREQFTDRFLHEFNREVLRRGQHIKCNGMIVAVKQIKSTPRALQGNTQVQYRVKGLPLRMKANRPAEEENGTLNISFVMESGQKSRQGSLDLDKDDVYSCYCCECKKCLSEGDFFIKTANWSRPILCLACYESFFTPKCVRCAHPITFDHQSVTSDGLACVRFVEHNELYWHSECCACVTCAQPLIGRKFYQEPYYNQLLCLEHIPLQDL